MPVEWFSARNFRCLAEIDFEPEPGYNLIHGQNASGKTSLLEAIAYLGPRQVVPRRGNPGIDPAW